MGTSDIRETNVVSKTPIFPVLIIKKKKMIFPRATTRRILICTEWEQVMLLEFFFMDLLPWFRRVSIISKNPMPYFISEIFEMDGMLKFYNVIAKYTAFLSSKYSDLFYLNLMNIPYYHSSLLHEFRQINYISWNTAQHTRWCLVNCCSSGSY